MHYRISAETHIPGEGVVRSWYAGRKRGTFQFEVDLAHHHVLHYVHFENARDDKRILERTPEIYRDVEIVTFGDNGQILDEDFKGRLGSTTIEIEQVSPLKVLTDVQEILGQIVASKMHTEISPETAHEQTRTALGLVLRAISILKKEERKKKL